MNQHEVKLGMPCEVKGKPARVVAQHGPWKPGSDRFIVEFEDGTEVDVAASEIEPSAARSR